MPPCFVVIETMQNQLLLEWKHLVYQYLFTLYYMIVTMIWQVSTSDAVIFPQTLDWICASRTVSEDDDTPLYDPSCIWSQCYRWFLVFMLVQTICYISILLIHYGKAKFCCRHSVPLDDKNYALINDEQEAK